VLFEDIQAFLLDMDGTVYLGPNPIPGSASFIQYLQHAGIPFLFLTNNPSADAAYYRDKLRRMGINVEPSNILTAGAATAVYLRHETSYRKLCVLGTPSFEDELLRAGMELESERPDAVVIAFDKTLTYAKLERACLLLNEGLPYIATNPDRVCPTEYGYIPDCGYGAYSTVYRQAGTCFRPDGLECSGYASGQHRHGRRPPVYRYGDGETGGHGRHSGAVGGKHRGRC